MPTERPRIQVTLDEHSNNLFSAIAEHAHLSKSALAADLICEALALREDPVLSDFSNARIASDNGKHHPHDAAWE